MRIPETLKIQDRSLDVYLGGPGFGEGVLIVIGKTIAIGIDCCSSFIHPRKTESFLEREIEKLPPDGLLVWVLTHFHYDHFHGLPSVLKRFSDHIKAAIFPLDYNPADVSYLAEQISEFPGSPTKPYRADKEYKNIRNLLKLSPFNHRVVRVQGIQQWLNIDLILPNKEVVPLGVRICSSSSEVYDKYMGMAVNKVRDEGVSSSRKDANRGSYIVHCCLGDFEGLFLGDAGTERVEQLLQNQLIGDNGIDCLKVGHHGSLDATDESLLNLCTRSKDKRKEQHALIAPYKSAGLPNEEIIELLKKFGYTVHISKSPTSDKKIKEGIISDGSVVTSIKVEEAMATGADIIVVNLGF